MILDDAPTICGEGHDGYFSAGHALLIFQCLISSNEDIESQRRIVMPGQRPTYRLLATHKRWHHRLIMRKSANFTDDGILKPYTSTRPWQPYSGGRPTGETNEWSYDAHGK
jgi:hypothetical protein